MHACMMCKEEEKEKKSKTVSCGWMGSVFLLSEWCYNTINTMDRKIANPPEDSRHGSIDGCLPPYHVVHMGQE